MQIHLRNEIDLGGQMEVIDQRFPVEVTEKNGHYYFVFTNDENEKVMIKSNSEELTMTRFSTPKSVLRFHRDNPVMVSIPTPLGYQHLLTETSTYHADFDHQLIKMNYELKQPETESVFAEYQMEISWQ
ncbi:DUF1934 domain-containing protein [Streptococcus caballi]|uniref:DUF1934 domain-containing protein n=1 Tax=Streptococcus caballi TaxID=439220 RepID=UPI00037DE6C7|nr:DUF1934 domain-containing protein [Streptococcus caballi]